MFRQMFRHYSDFDFIDHLKTNKIVRAMAENRDPRH